MLRTMPRRLRTLRTLAWVLNLLVLPGLIARAEEYRYPKENPVLALAIPAEWDVEQQTGPALLLLCTPPDELSYTISLLTLPTVGNQEDTARVLTQIVNAGAKGAGLTDIVVSKPTEEAVGKGARLFTKVTATGKHNDEASAFTYYAFRLPSNGRSYAIGVAGAQAMIDAHRADFEAVVRSIGPVKPGLPPSGSPAAKPLPTTTPPPTPGGELLRQGDGPRVQLAPKT